MTQTTETLPVFQSKLGDERLERVQMNDALLYYVADIAEGDGCTVRSAEGTEYYGEVVYHTPKNRRCEYGCEALDLTHAHVHVSIS